MLNVPERPPSTARRTENPLLVRWLHQVIRLPQLRITVKLRGTQLYLLCEDQSCPLKAAVVPRVVQALTDAQFKQLLPNALIHQVIVYGRALDNPRPDWAEVMQLDQIDRHLNQFSKPSRSETERSASDSELIISTAPTSPGDRQEAATRQRGASAIFSLQPPIALSPPLLDPQTLQLARQGDATAIAQCLAETLGHLGVSVRASVKPAPLEQNQDEKVGKAQDGKRLSVLCESHYSPDASLMAAAIAQKLRELQLPGFRSAQVFGQVQGETQPEWALWVDLTPPGEMLREWARWGDVAAISRLLNRALAAQQVKVSASLNETTLHITCQSPGQAPEKAKLRPAIAALLESLAPQGIHSATIYGVGKAQRVNGDNKTDRGEGETGREGDRQTATPPYSAETPTWVDWLNLPAADTLDRADSTLTVAQQGNLAAIAFLLTRLLNPDVKTYLATGGTRIQIRQKGDLLHIMADAPVCPQQATVTTAIVRFLTPLSIQGITGIRLYGRRAGQTRPFWSWGKDFGDRSPSPRSVAEATPEFAASDAYVGDLLAAPGELVWQPDAQLVWQSEPQPNQLEEVLHRAVETVQRILVRTQLFVHSQPSRNLTAVVEPELGRRGQGGKVALVWGILGLLLTLQTDWMLGQVLRTRANASSPRELPAAPIQEQAPEQAPEQTVQLPALSLKKSDRQDKSAFNSSGFTQTGRAVITAEAQRESGEAVLKPLLAAPLQQKAVVDGAKSPYPTFNAKQLDEKLVLYRQYVAKSGVPDVLILGSSRAMRGIDPTALQTALAAQGYPGLKIFNFGVNGATAQVENLILRRVLAAEKLPKLIVWADGARAFNSGRLDVTYNAIAVSPGYKKLPAEPEAQLATTAPPQPTAAPMPTSALPAVPNSILTDSYQTFNVWLDQAVANVSTVYPQREQLKSLLQGKLVATMAQQTGATDAEGLPTLIQEGKGLIDVNGFLPLSNRFNPVTYHQKYSRVTGDHDSDYADFRMDGSQTQALEAIVQFTQERQIPLVFINLPLTRDYLDPIRQAHEDEFDRYMIQTSAELSFTYRNLANRFTADPDFFSDPSHLNRYGAFAISNQIAKDVLIPWVKR